MSDFPSRLRRVIDYDFRRKVSVFAEACKEVDPEHAPSASTLRKYLAGKSQPTLDKLRCIVKASRRDAAFFVESAEYEHAIFYSSRDLVNFGKYLREAKQRIDLLTTSLTFLTDERELRTYLEEIVSALENSSRLIVKFLVLSPQSDFTARRAVQLNYEHRIRIYRENLTRALDIVRKTAKLHPDRFHVRLFDELPAQISFIIDNRVLSSAVVKGISSRKSVTFEMLATWPGVSKTFIEHFSSVWDASNVEDALAWPDTETGEET